LPPFPNRTESTITSLVVTKDEIKDILKTLKINKASGPDGISHTLLKNTAESICKPLQLLFNTSLSLCKFPSQ